MKTAEVFAKELADAAEEHMISTEHDVECCEDTYKHLLPLVIARDAEIRRDAFEDAMYIIETTAYPDEEFQRLMDLRDGRRPDDIVRDDAHRYVAPRRAAEIGCSVCGTTRIGVQLDVEHLNAQPGAVWIRPNEAICCEIEKLLP